MIPFAEQTVTLIQRAETVGSDGKRHATYSKHVMQGCSWRMTKTVARNDSMHVPSLSAIVRIPADQKRPAAGDLLVLGVYSGNVTSSAQYESIIETHRNDGGAFVVREVTDNSLNGLLDHYKAVG